MVTIKSVNGESLEEFIEFFKQRESDHLIYEPWTEQYGYFIEVKDEKLGFFVLYPLNDGKVWLRRLVMNEKTKPFIFVLVFDWIAEKAKELGFSELYVHIHEETFSFLIELSHFKQTYEPPVNEFLDLDWYVRRLND